MIGVPVAVRPLLLIMFFLAACATSPAENFAAAPNLEKAVRDEAPPSDGKARIGFLLGTVSSPLVEMDLHAPADFFVNGMVAGGINEGEVLIVELAPGTYDFTWDMRAGGSSRIVPFRKEVKAGEILYLKGDINMGSGGIFGLAGDAIDPSGNHLSICEGNCKMKIQNLKVVVAQK